MNYDSITAVGRRSRARVHTIERTRFGEAALTGGRILLALAMILATVIVADATLRAAFVRLGVDPLASVPLMLAGGLVGTLAVLGGYVTYVRWIEARSVTELARRGAARELLSGAVLGAALFTAAIGVV